jgi:hypothetical protein
MRIKLMLLATIAIALVLSACNRKTVHLDYTNCKGEVQQLGNLVFRFNKALVKDSLLNQWDSTEYVSFEPAIAGRFRWEHPDELVFSPSRPLPPATTFKAKLNNQLLKNTGYSKVASTDDLIFHTPDLKLDNINFTWMLQDEVSKSIIPQLDLYFNYAVKPEVLKENLKILFDNKPVNFNLQTTSTDTKLSVQLLGMKVEDRDYAGKIMIAKALKPEAGNNAMKEDIEFPVSLTSPYVLNINDVTTEHDGTNGTVYIKTSQQLTGEDLSSFFKFEPAIKYTVALTDDGCVISSGQFEVTRSYQLNIAKGLRGKIGGTLRDDYSNTVAFGELEPTISFQQSKAVYLSSKGAENVAIRIAAVPKVRLVISKIYESNLLAADRYGYEPRVNNRSSNNEEGDYRDYDEGYGGDYMLGDVLYDKEIDTRSLAKSGSFRLLNFNISDKLPEFKGIYHVSVRSTTDYWVSDSRFISLSDIGLIAKEGRDKFYVFANSIKTTNPVSGVNVVLYGNNNQVLASGATNGDGVAEMSYVKKQYAGFRPAMLIAKTADDFNYLPLKSTRVNTSRFDVSGKHINSTGLDAFVYTERDMYRPGEKINFSVVIRDNQWKSPGELPVKMKLLMPNGKELITFRKNLNEQGSLEASVDIATAAITGSYTLEVYTSNDVLLATKSFHVEEFVPDRIKVEVKTDKKDAGPGEKIQLDVKAQNFFGPPASDRNYECDIQLSQKYFYSEKYNRYSFGLSNQSISFDHIVRNGKTNAEGKATEVLEIPDAYRNVGMLTANFYATVFDETGRPVSRSVAVDIPTQPYFLGIADDGYYYYPLNQKMSFPLIALNKDGQLLNGAQATVTVIKHEYRTVLARSGSYFRYESQVDDKVLAYQTINVSGEATNFSFVPRTPGNYEIRVALPGTNAYLSRSFYSYGAWGNDNSSFEVDNDGNIEIETDKASYNTGETAKLLFKAPFSGKMLITYETDKVVSYQYVNIDKRTASVDLKVQTDHLPGLYVTATLIKPHEVSDMPLTVAHGFKHLKIEEKGRKIAVQILAKEAVRSRTHQTVKIKTLPGSLVTLAAVDNGVLQLSNFQTPDPYEYFYSRKALEVNAYDMYPLLFPEIRARLSSSGGDGSADMNKRTNPIQAKRFKILSYWSGIREADGSGNATFEFDIPAFSGEVRLMVVTYKDEKFGSAEANMKVADPIVLSSALPRFLSPGDTITVPVTITNTTGKSTQATASLKLNGPLQVAGAASQPVSLAANSESRAYFKLYALGQLGVAKINVQVNGLGENFSDETDIAVRPSAGLQKMNGSGAVAGNTSQNISINTGDFMQGSVDYNFVVSRSPAMEIAGQLSYLLHYPYGCTEQTISAAFPQLYFADLADLMKTTQTNALKLTANYNIREAIRKIKMRQLYTGAVTLWDDEGTANWWATVYAAHFLIEAQKAGFDVDKSLIETILGYINNRLKNRETISYYYNRTMNKKIAPKETIYSLYVLALAGKPNVSVMNYYKANQQLLSLDSKYLLSVAYALSGDKNMYKELLPAQFAGEESVAQTGGSFYSDVRDEAIALNSLIDIDPANAQVPVMARHVVNKLKNRRYYSTQECSFSFLALGKLARNNRQSNVTADIKVNGKVVGRMTGADLKLNTKQLGGTNIEIVTKGNGQLYYFWESEGVSSSGSYKEEDSYIKVRKIFYDRFGHQINGNAFKQNDLIVIGITLERSFNTDIDNIVITDMLPAGFEIENPRTKEIPGMDWIKNASYPTALDMRDDRINLFVDLHNRQQTYYYAVRAVSPGVYRMGPVSADAMYNGEYHSYHGAGTIKVTQ